jgi:hypothetical protein
MTMPHWHTTASSGRRDASARARDHVVVLILVLALIGGLETPHVGAQPGKPPAGPGMSGDAATAALAAALRIFDGVPQADCATNNPGQRICIALAHAPLGAPERGIAVLATGSPPGRVGDAGLVVMGRAPDGAWGLWFGTQNPPYQRLDLPGNLLVCADGAGAPVRAAPDPGAATLATLPDLTRVVGEEFVLTRPGAVSPLRAGAGWYRLSAPAAGWIEATLLTDARWGDCTVRDAYVHGRPAGGPDPAGAALAAAAQITGLTIGVCTPEDPPGTGRVTTGRGEPSPEWRESVARGIALVDLQYCMDAGSWMVLGRTPTGAWAFWNAGNRSIVQRYDLPGDMLVCADVAAFPLREAPHADAPIVATVPYGAIVTGDSFLLTEPGAHTVREGRGWYRLVAPYVGWAQSQFLIDARWPDCTPRGVISPDVAYSQLPFVAALRLYDALPGPCAPGDGPDGPPRITRLYQLSGIPEEARWRESVMHGIATFLLELCGRTSGRIVLGRMMSGDWGLLRGGPVGPAPAFLLPGEMIVCAAEGAALRERPNADAPIVTVLPDGTQVTGVDFVLTESGVVGGDPYGAGWYQLAEPWAGWAYSESLFDPEAGGCPPRSGPSGRRE